MQMRHPSDSRGEPNRFERAGVMRDTETSLVSALYESPTPIDTAQDAAEDAAGAHLPAENSDIHRRNYRRKQLITASGLFLALLGLIIMRSRRSTK